MLIDWKYFKNTLNTENKDDFKEYEGILNEYYNFNAGILFLTKTYNVITIGDVNELSGNCDDCTRYFDVIAYSTSLVHTLKRESKRLKDIHIDDMKKLLTNNELKVYNYIWNKIINKYININHIVSETGLHRKNVWYILNMLELYGIVKIFKVSSTQLIFDILM